MGKSTPSPPPAPNPAQVVQQQGVANTSTAIAQARLNNTNQVTPYGNLTYNETGGGYDSNNTWVPQFTATTSLTPEQQHLFDTQQQISQGTSDLANSYVGRIRDATAQPFNFDANGFRQQQLQNIETRAAPQQAQDQRALVQRLADQGVNINDPAYATAMRQYQGGLNDFRLGADLQAGTEANAELQRQLAIRNQPINEVSALMGTGPGVQMPQFTNTPQTQIAPTDVGGIYNGAYQGGLQGYGLQLQAQNASLGGLYGLAGTLGGAGLLAAGPGLFGLAGQTQNAWDAGVGRGYQQGWLR